MSHMLTLLHIQFLVTRGLYSWHHHIQWHVWTESYMSSWEHDLQQTWRQDPHSYIRISLAFFIDRIQEKIRTWSQSINEWFFLTSTTPSVSRRSAINPSKTGCGILWIIFPQSVSHSHLINPQKLTAGVSSNTSTSILSYGILPTYTPLKLVTKLTQ